MHSQPRELVAQRAARAARFVAHGDGGGGVDGDNLARPKLPLKIVGRRASAGQPATQAAMADPAQQRMASMTATTGNICNTTDRGSTPMISLQAKASPRPALLFLESVRLPTSRQHEQELLIQSNVRFPGRQ